MPDLASLRRTGMIEEGAFVYEFIFALPRTLAFFGICRGFSCNLGSS